MTPDTPSRITSRLRGPWPQVGRLIVMAVAAFGLVINGSSLVVGWDALAQPCEEPGPLCGTIVTVEQAKALEAIGVPLTTIRSIGVIIAIAVTLTFLVIAGLILWRRADTWMGLLTGLLFVLVGSQGVGGNYLVLIESYPGLRYPAALLNAATFALFIPFIALFPNGRFTPLWTRWLTFIATPSLLLANSLYWFPPPLSQAADIALLLDLISIALGLVAQVIRYRKFSTSHERQQTKWVVVGLAAFFTALAMVFILSVPAAMAGMSPAVQASAILGFIVLFPCGVLALPLTVGVSLLRYRLWDVDFLINRSVVYGALTALLIALFGGSLFVVNALFQNFAGGPVVAVAISAVTFGALFQSARRNLQRFVDRRFYHIQIDYNKTPAPLPAATSTTSVLKQTRFGEYQNLELIGRGGMAEIYKSTHPTLGVPVAIKVLPAHLASDPDFRKRFDREAQTVAKLQHPNIIRVFGYGEADGTHYMVMEYIAGNDLGHYLAQQGRLPLAEALPLLKGIADALDYAHTQGLVHRDIKPANILLDPDGAGPKSSPIECRAVLTDFGIAKILGGVTRYTQTGGVLGTFDYIAPEQIQGAADVDGRADVYAFGVVAYHILTGALPFQQRNPGALLIAHMMQPAPDPRDLVPDLSSDVAHAIQRAMAKKPEERFATAGEFINVLI